MKVFRERTDGPAALIREGDACLSAAEFEFRPSIALSDVISGLTRLPTGLQEHRQLRPCGNTNGGLTSSGLR